MIINRIKRIVPDCIKARIVVDGYYKNLVYRMKDLERENERVSLIIGTAIHTNLGDHLISIASFKYLKYIGYKTKVIEIPTEMYKIFRKRIIKLSCIDTVFINGGGWLGNLWVPEELLVQQILNDFANKKVVILPQTVYFDPKIKPYNTLINSANMAFTRCRDVTLFVRESNSYNFSITHYSNLKVVLIPDMALSFYQWAPKNNHKFTKKVGVCFRNDREQFGLENDKIRCVDWFIQNGYCVEHINTMNEYRVRIEEREHTVIERLKLFAKYDFIVTDRLHGMIFSYICGTPCIVFDNKTHKVSGVYNTWLCNSKRILPMFLDKEYTNLEKFVSLDLDFDENVCTIDQFDKLREIILNG